MFQKIDPKEWKENLFATLSDQWMLVTAGTPERCNTMTASWGGAGVLWGKNIAVAFVRPQRYTREFMDAQEGFSLNVLGEQYREELKFCGARSGRDVDKVTECGFTVAAAEGNVPYFEQAQTVLVCRKLYVDRIKPELFLDPGIAKWYPGKDYHYVYVGEITELLQKS